MQTTDPIFADIDALMGRLAARVEAIEACLDQLGRVRELLNAAVPPTETDDPPARPPSAVMPPAVAKQKAREVQVVREMSGRVEPNKVGRPKIADSIAIRDRILAVLTAAGGPMRVRDAANKARVSTKTLRDVTAPLVASGQVVMAGQTNTRTIALRADAKPKAPIPAQATPRPNAPATTPDLANAIIRLLKTGASATARDLHRAVGVVTTTDAIVEACHALISAGRVTKLVPDNGEIRFRLAAKG